jgi:flagellar protein FlgJ
MFQGLVNEGVQSDLKLQQIDQLATVLEQSPQGARGVFALALGEYGIATEGLDEVQAAQALINQIVPQQRQPGSGPMSDADLALFKQSVPRVLNQPGGNQAILSTMRDIALYTREQSRIASMVADRQITPAEGRKMLQSLANPLEGISDLMGQTNQAAPDQGQGQPSLNDLLKKY